MPAAPSGFQQFKRITIDNTNVDALLTDFPLLVKFTDDAEIGADIDDDGYNLRFTAADNTVLDYDRRAFDNTGDEATGVVFTRVPSISAVVDTDICVYFKAASPSDGEDKAGTWQDYELVAPLNEPDGDSSGYDYVDITGNSAGGIGNGDQVSGQFDFAQDFDGTTSEKIIFAAPSNIGAEAYSVSAWINPDIETGSARLLWCSGFSSTFNSIFYIGAVLGGLRLSFRALSNTGGSQWALKETSGAEINSGSWFHVAGTWDGSGPGGSGIELYVDGVAPATNVSGSGSSRASNDDWVVSGVENSALSGIDGKMQELRVRKSELSAAWLKFEHANIFESDNELTFGPVELALTAGADDADYVEFIGSETDSGAVLNVGEASFDFYAALLRFDVSIPQGATITSASLRITCGFGADYTGDTFTIDAADEDDPVMPTGGSSTSISFTTATATDDFGNLTTGQRFATVDIASVIQEVVDRPGFGGSILFRIRSDSASSGLAFPIAAVENTDGWSPASLVAEWTVPAAFDPALFLPPSEPLVGDPILEPVPYQ